tara:strand:- start:188 stop:412 length:225 start_codon:yes stop_codon:yes gene_type:complete
MNDEMLNDMVSSGVSAWHYVGNVSRAMRECALEDWGHTPTEAEMTEAVLRYVDRMKQDLAELPPFENRAEGRDW